VFAMTTYKQAIKLLEEGKTKQVLKALISAVFK